MGLRWAYYPGCSLKASAIDYGISIAKMANLLGIDLLEIPDWTCCGASSAHQLNHYLSIVLPALNLARAERKGLPVFAPCAACYNRFRKAEHEIRSDPDLKREVEKSLGTSFEALFRTVSVLELISTYGLDKLKSKVTRPLTGMKPACYYGCLLVRPPEITGFDEPENPVSMDRIMTALGASPVPWAYKSECCGAGLSVSEPDVGLTMTYKVLKNAQEVGANSIVTACPICMLNLDMRQEIIADKFKMKFDLPVYYITELVAVACGEKPQRAGIDKHYVEAVSFLAELQAKNNDTARPIVSDLSCDGAANSQALELAAQIFDDEVRVRRLVEVLGQNPGYVAKLAVMLTEDKDQAARAAHSLLRHNSA